MLKYGQDIEYIRTWDLAILGVPKRVCVSVENTSIFEELSGTVLHRTKITGDDDSMRERLLASVKTVKTVPDQQKPGKVNIITIKHSNTKMAQKGSFTCSVLF